MDSNGAPHSTPSPAQSSREPDNRDEEVRQFHTKPDKAAISEDAFDGYASQTIDDGAKEPWWSTYKQEWLWCRIWSVSNSLKRVHWKNSRALPGRAYTPTEVGMSESVELILLISLSSSR